MKQTIIIIIALTLSFIAGLYFPRSEAIENKIKVKRSKSANLTNPLLDCEISDYLEPKTRSIKNKVTDVIHSHDSYYSNVSVYFRDLNNGPWFGINERYEFAPASLLKVPLMIAYLKQAESNPQLLTEKVKYSGTTLLKENIPLEEQLTKGVTYSTDELLLRMIAFSDNISFEILLKNIDDSTIKTLHTELELTYPNKETPLNYISVKNYAGLFRVLYNSTYLSRNMSEKALEYLTASEFDKGIKAGIPKNIKAALKFGVRNEPDPTNTVQLHDCGIIYAPQKPYLLCIMTKGNSIDELSTIIKDISTAVYQKYVVEQ
jgi:beta-lactamase class A